MNEPPEFDAEKIVAYWLTEAEEAFQVAQHLMESADYSYALFFGHLAVEKTLKALHAHRLRQHAPPIHNLLRLARRGWPNWSQMQRRPRRLSPSPLSTSKRATQI